MLGRDALIAVSIPETSRDLPDSALGYDGVDMMMINGASAPLLRELTNQQRSAIADWMSGGGKVFLTLGESASRPEK